MAANTKAIGLLFEVAGQGSISGETGKLINQQLKDLVNAINSSDTLKLKFSIDSKHIESEIEKIKKQLQSLSSISVSGTRSGGGKGGGAGGASAHSSAWADASNSLKNYYNLLTQLTRAMTRTKDIAFNKESGSFTAPDDSRWKTLTEQVNRAKAALDEYTSGAKKSNLTEAEQELLHKKNSAAMQKLQLDATMFSANGQEAWSNLTAKVHDYISRVEYSASRSPEATQKINELRRMANSTDWRGYDALKAKLGEVQQYINQNALSTETWYQKMKKTFGTRVRSLLAGLTLAKVTQSLRDVYKYVVDIDTAMTNLKIVTGESEDALQQYANTAKRAAITIGASISDLIKSTTTYARLGFSLEDAGKLAELTTAYSKVGDISVDDATKNITGIVKAYQVSGDALEDVIDKLIYVGRRFAISSSEIGEGMNNAASSLAANGNTLNQAIGILTAANTTVQNISRASTATRTIAARLSASKQELEELGETVEADTIFKLAKSFKAYGIEIQEGNGQLKSTYRILNSIAEKWSELDDAERAAIAGLAAGTRQQDIFYSIIQNWNDARRVVAEADYATGELSRATEERLDSIQGKIDQLKARLESLSQVVLSSDWVKIITDILGGVLSALNAILSVGDSVIFKIILFSALLVGLTKAWNALRVGFLKAKVDIAEMIALQTALSGAQAGTITTTKLLTAALLKYTSTGVLGVITVIPRAIFAIGLWIKSHIAAKAATDAGTASAITFKGALDALNVNPVMLAVTALVALVVGGVTALSSLYQAEIKASRKAREHAEALTEIANKAREESDAIKELIDQYNALAEAGTIDADKRKEIRDIQEQINRLTGNQSGNLDLINGQLDEELAKLQAIKAEKAKQAAERSEAAFVASLASANTAAETNLSDIDGKFKKWLLGWVSNNGLGAVDLAVDDYDQAAADILNKIAGFTAYSQGGAGVDDRTDITLNADGAYESVAVIERGLEALRNTAGYDYFNSAVYRELEELKNQYQEYVTSADESTKQYIASLVESRGYEAQVNGTVVKSWEDYEKLRTEILNTVSAEQTLSSALKQGYVSQKDVNEAVDDFLAANYGNLYEQHTQTVNGYKVALKSLPTILDEVQTGFDGLSEAMESVTTDGYLTAEGLSKLLKLQQDNALGGLNLSDILKEDAQGYRLATDALDLYVKSLLEEYAAISAFATEKDKENAKANLESLYRVLATIIKTQKKATDVTNEQKDALKDQLSAYKKLIDLRKKLLKQYEDELNYKKELSEKESRVSQLQSQLAVSQLDTSASGRAKSREIASDLQEAQEDLDDFTLEHAIETVTNELDEQYEQYESYINGKIDELERKVEEIKPTDVSGLETLLSSVKDTLDLIEKKNVVVNVQYPSGGGGEGQEGGGVSAEHLRKGVDYSVSGLDVVSMGKDDISVTIGGKTYDAKVSTKKSGDSEALSNMYGGIVPVDGTIAVLNGNAYIVKKRQWRKLVKEQSGDIAKAYSDKLSAQNAAQTEYHAGGVVGSVAKLKTTEMFAKLLKGEFVATPQMMKRFMTSTLPELAYSGASGGSNEFNAPLINIQCDNITQESLPGLKEIVNDAVKEIKKQLDGGLGRAGYRKPANQIV